MRQSVLTSLYGSVCMSKSHSRMTDASVNISTVQGGEQRVVWSWKAHVLCSEVQISRLWLLLCAPHEVGHAAWKIESAPTYCKIRL